MSDYTEFGIGNSQTADEINAMVLGQPITIEALKAAGFEDKNHHYGLVWEGIGKLRLFYDTKRKTALLGDKRGLFYNDPELYPTNMAQIETLKELLTPK